MFSGIVAFLKALPALIGIIREIFKFLHETLDYLERLKKTQELKVAVKEARETKNTTKLENLFGSSNPQPSANSEPNTVPAS